MGAWLSNHAMGVIVLDNVGQTGRLTAFGFMRARSTVMIGVTGNIIGILSGLFKCDVWGRLGRLSLLTRPASRCLT